MPLTAAHLEDLRQASEDLLGHNNDGHTALLAIRQIQNWTDSDWSAQSVHIQTRPRANYQTKLLDAKRQDLSKAREQFQAVSAKRQQLREVIYARQLDLPKEIVDRIKPFLCNGVFGARA